MAAEWYTDSKLHSIELLLDELFLVLHDSYDIVSNRCQLYHFESQIPMRQRHLPMSFFIPPNQLRSTMWSEENSTLESHYSPVSSHQLTDPCNQVYASIEVTSTTLKYQKTVQIPTVSMVPPGNMALNCKSYGYFNGIPNSNLAHCSSEFNLAIESHPHHTWNIHNSCDNNNPYCLNNLIPRSDCEEKKSEPNSSKSIQSNHKTKEPCYRIVSEWVPHGQELVEAKTNHSTSNVKFSDESSRPVTTISQYTLHYP